MSVKRLLDLLRSGTCLDCGGRLEPTDDGLVCYECGATWGAAMSAAPSEPWRSPLTGTLEVVAEFRGLNCFACGAVGIELERYPRLVARVRPGLRVPRVRRALR